MLLGGQNTVRRDPDSVLKSTRRCQRSDPHHFVSTCCASGRDSMAAYNATVRNRSQIFAFSYCILSPHSLRPDAKLMSFE